MKIKWDAQIKEQIEDIFKFNRNMFGSSKSKLILKSVMHHISLLKQFPQLGPIDTPPYRSLTHKHIKIYYTIEPEFIYIALIWDIRQDPEKLRKYLK